MRALVLVVALAGCAGDPSSDAGRDAAVDAPADAASDASADSGPPELRADAGVAQYAIAGEEVVLDGSASTGATRYQWSFGNGDGWSEPRPDPIARVVYASPGRYRAVLAALDELGRRRTASVLVSVTHPLVHTPSQSGSLAIDRSANTIAVVSPDSNELAVYAIDDLTLQARSATPGEPRTVARWGEDWAVVCQGAGVVALIGPSGARTVALPRASRPFGAAASGDALFVTLQATGQLARLERQGTSARVAWIADALPDARGVAILPDGRVAVTRWRSPDDGARIAVLSPDGSTRTEWTLAYDPRPASDTESGGVPSYLDQLVVSPTGRLAIVPSLQAAIGEGLFRGPRPLTFQTTLRAVLSFIDPATGEERNERRKFFDNRGLASAAALTSRGDYAYVSMRGARSVERLDVLTGAQAGSVLDVGFAPQGLALSPDDRLLFVDAFLSRELVVYDVGDPGALPRELARLRVASSEPLAPSILRGKVLFNDSYDTRLARDGYIACAHCHLDGLGDRRTWDFTDRGEGLRNTIDLIGRAGTAQGLLHWSANFDEVQDFEHDIRGAFRGTGLMSDADLAMGTRGTTLGDPKAGASEDLDALAAYVSSLDRFPESPYRNEDGSLPDAAVRGRAVFASAGCPTCHAGAALTDSGWQAPGVPRLHDVGTLGPGSGRRLGGPLLGLDTPTLHGLWDSPPYLHDGSAATLREVLTTRNAGDAHGLTSMVVSSDLDDLIAYLLCLDGRDG